MKPSCSLCSSPYGAVAFKGGAVCEECLKYIRQHPLPSHSTAIHRK